MNIYKQTKTGNSQLLLVFSGWAASPEVFRQLETEPDTDLWICYDYRGMDFEGEALSGYRKIRLVAWSLGVWAASVVFGKKPVSFTEAIAVIPAPSEEQKGKILDCVQTGYTLNDKVIRHAKVVVGE